MNNLTANYNFPDIISHFKTDEGTYNVKPFGSGHINDTFIARHIQDPASVYLLQKINHHTTRSQILKDSRRETRRFVGGGNRECKK